MKKLITIIVLIAIYQFINAQEVNFTHEAGKVTQYEMSLSEYSKDNDAEAIVIYDLGDYRFFGHDRRGFLLKMERRTKIKILKQAGIKYANFEIPYYVENRDFETISDIKATTFNYEDGKLIKTELNNKNIFEEKINNNWYVKKIALSDVREGSVIEFSYIITTPYFVHMREWNFQRKIPVVFSKLNYRAIPYYEYTYILKGSDKLDIMKNEVRMGDIRFGNLLYKEMDYEFGMKDLPAFKDEEYITSEEDYMVSLNFQLSKLHHPRGGSEEIMSTWKQISDDFMKSDQFGKYMKTAEKEAKKILPTLDLQEKTTVEQTQAITEYVKRNYNWNGIQSKYTGNTKVSDLLKEKTGNSAAINLFLAGLLKAANINAEPVVLSTRKNGIIRKQYPFKQFLNYVIVMVKIDNKVYYLDGTEPLLHYSDLPERCINVEGLIVNPKTEVWVPISQRIQSIKKKDLKITLVPDENKMEVKADFAGIGYDAYKYRRIYLGKESNLITFLKDNHNIDVKGNINISENDKLNRPFVFSFQCEAPFDNASDKIFVHPFCNLSINDNPFKQVTRTLLVDLMYIRSENYTTSIEIPHGYKIEYVPQPIAIDDSLIKFDYMIQQTDNKISLSALYSFKKNVYEAKDYMSLKMSFNEIIKKMSDMIIFVKE